MSPTGPTPSNTQPLSGHCLCGATRFEISPPFNFTGHCHCESCRRQTASPFTTFVGVPDGQWRWLGETPSHFSSTPGVKRFFCPGCGAPAAFQADWYPGEVHFYVALLDDPEAVTPANVFHRGEEISWVADARTLPDLVAPKK